MSATSTPTSATTEPFPVGTPAYREWHCGFCNTGLVNAGSTHVCEVCGCRYDSDTGAYLGGRGPSRL